MDQDEENLVEPHFQLKTLEEAATYDILQLQENLHPEDTEMYKCYQAFYLEQVYGLIQSTMLDKGWKPLNADLLCKWEDQLWAVYLGHYGEFNEFIPNCEKAGYTLATIFWPVLCGLSLLNHCWRAEAPWKALYNAGATGKDLPFALYNFLVFCEKPIIAHTVHDLMGQIFTLTTKFYELEYHPELEIWIMWLQTRVAELMYIVTTRDLFNSQEWCAPRPRPNTSGTFKVADDSGTDLFGISDSFVQETGRLFYDLRGTLYRYKMYPRLLVECSSQHTNLRERQISFPEIQTLKLPISESMYCEHAYISQFFFATEDDVPIISTRWKTWVERRLKDFYHDRSKITLHKAGLVQTLRPGEYARATAGNQGVPPGFYEILKKNRPMGTLDNLDFHAFNIPKEALMAYCADLNRKSNRIKDSAFLYLLDQYMYHTFNIRFQANFARQEHEWSQNVDDLEKNDHPMIIQVLGGWDVYCMGEVTQTRNLGRAFLIWCYKIASRFMGMVYKAISIQPMLKELLFSEEPQNQATPMQTEDTSKKQNSAVASYWI